MEGQAQTNQNDTVEQIDNPSTKGKLEGMQEVANDFGAYVMKLHSDLEQKKGVVAAAKMIAARIMAEREPIQHEIDVEKMDPDEAKIRINQIEKIAFIVQDIERNNHTDITLIRGRIEGLKVATDLVENRFNGEIGKHERWKRIEEEEAAEEADLRGVPEDDSVQKEAASTEEKADGNEGGNGKEKPKRKKSKKGK